MAALDQILDRLVIALRANRVTPANGSSWADQIDAAREEVQHNRRIEARDNLFRAFRAKYFSGLSDEAAAMAIADQVTLRHQRRPVNVFNHNGTP
jgi:hypothetical protein